MDWLILLIPAFFICKTIFSKMVENNSEIETVFNDFNKKMKPIERHDVVQELFVKSAQHIKNSALHLDNVSFAIYSAELALHIFALYVSNRLVKFQNKEQIKAYYESLEFMSFVICIKEFLNLIIENSLNQKGIDSDTIKEIIITRVTFIFKEEDFEVRNFNFQNLCNIAIQYEENCVFYIGSYEKLHIAPGSPLNMMILPSAYKIGLVDEFLKKLELVS